MSKATAELSVSNRDQSSEALPSGAAARLFGALVGVQKAPFPNKTMSPFTVWKVHSQAGGFLQDVWDHGVTANSGRWPAANLKDLDICLECGTCIMLEVVWKCWFGSGPCRLHGSTRWVGAGVTLALRLYSDPSLT